MSSRYDDLVMDWHTAFKRGEQVVGGKAWNLARLHRYGLPVPDGIVLAAPLYDLVIDANGLRPLVQECLDCPVSAAGQLPLQVAELQKRILTASLPLALTEAITAKLASTGSAGVPLAVRSSATGEDSETASFAGIHESFLNVQGESALEEAVRGCYASLWSERAVSYRRRLGISDVSVAPAVVIMPLIQARAAGVAFSCDPLSGREDTMVIAANFGLGEAVVSGLTDPDSYEVHNNTVTRELAVSGVRLGDKQTITTTVAGGTAQVAGTERHEQVLNNQHIVALAALVRRVLMALGDGERHQDVEWVQDQQGEFHLVQARPVTGKPHYCYPALAGQPVLWSNANYRDVIPMVQTPLNWSFSTPLANRIFLSQYGASGYCINRAVQRSRLFNGRAYFNLSQMQWECYDAYGFSPTHYNRFIGGHQPEITLPPRETGGVKLARLWRNFKLLQALKKAKKRSSQTFADLVQRIDTARALDVAQFSRHELNDLMNDMDRMFATAKDVHLLIAIGGAVFVTLTPLLERFAPGRGLPLTAALLAGQEGVTSADHGTELAELAEIAGREAVCQELFAARPFVASAWRDLPASSEFRRRFAAFLATYGHRAVYELDLRTPRWHEDPTYLLEMIRSMIGTTTPAAIRERQSQAATTAWQEVQRCVPALLQPLIRSMVKNGGKDGANREMAKSILVRMGDVTRKVILEIGRQLAAQGLLRTTDDIFFLHWPELDGIMNNSIGSNGLQELVADRRERHAAFEQLTPPDIIIEEGGTSRVPVSPDADGKGLRGIGVSSGRVSGIARIVRHPDEGQRLNAGEILVAPSTDPAWTPLFLRAAALVTETGGIISHGAIVAREYGIPAVLNVRGVLGLIQDGQQITVDGDRGVVEIV